jgi:hypothetical protein
VWRLHQPHVFLGFLLTGLSSAPFGPPAARSPLQTNRYPRSFYRRRSHRSFLPTPPSKTLNPNLDHTATAHSKPALRSATDLLYYCRWPPLSTRIRATHRNPSLQHEDFRQKPVFVSRTTRGQREQKGASKAVGSGSEDRVWWCGLGPTCFSLLLLPAAASASDGRNGNLEQSSF